MSYPWCDISPLHKRSYKWLTVLHFYFSVLYNTRYAQRDFSMFQQFQHVTVF
jgi:hypothetical protein